uniref:TIGR02099 family protein n=1 Tax=Candidatus Kentrum sp. DK TaxID=2126562 RepID=A0A450SMH3_9GAMM|nr:MAG: TIGR02099 family protein [Candidatus Kentron sp. DK]
MIIQGLDEPPRRQDGNHDRITPKRSYRVFSQVIRALAVLIAVGLLTLRFLLPGVEQLRPDVEQWLQAKTGQPVSIGSLHAQWRGWTPELVIEKLRLLNEAGDALHIQFLRFGIGIDFSFLWQGPASWKTLRKIDLLRAKRVSLSGMSLTMIREPDGSIHPAGTRSASAGLLSWLLKQSHVDVESADIHWRDRKNEQLSFSFPNTRLSIRGEDSRYRILASTSPSRLLPEKVRPSEDPDPEGTLSTVADITLDPVTLRWSGTALFRIRDLNPSRLFPRENPLSRITSVGASAEFQTSWRQGRFESAEGDFTLGCPPLSSADIRAGDNKRPVPSPARSSQGSCMASAPTETPITGISGSLALGRLGSDNWSLAFGRLVLATPEGQWAPTDARLEIAWSRNREAWEIAARDVQLSNEDLALRLDGIGRWSGEQASPDLYLNLAIERGRLDRLIRYLPTSLMKESLVSWLRRAFIGGTIEKGSVLFHGRPTDFPFRDSEGVFEARFRTSQDTALRYAEEWLPIETAAMDVAFENQHLTVRAESGFVYGSRIREVVAEIPDITVEQPLLTVHGQTVGAFEEGLAFLRTSPLSERHAHHVTGLEGSGEIRIDLRIRRRLPRDDSPSVQGEITFVDDGIDVGVSGFMADTGKSKPAENGDPDLHLDHIKGAITFDKDGIAGKDIAARYLGEAVTLDIEKVTREATDQETGGSKGATRFTVSALPTNTLFSYPLLQDALSKVPASLSAVLAPAATGLTDETKWRVMLELPHSWGQRDSRETAWIGISSPLAGIGALLPAPLRPPFEARMVLSKEPSEREITIRLGSETDDSLSTALFAPGPASGKAEKAGESWRGAVRFGAGSPKLPDSAGVRVEGHVKALSLDQWLPLIRLIAKNNPVSGTPDALATRGKVFPVEVFPDSPKPDSSKPNAPENDNENGEKTAEADSEKKVPVATLILVAQRVHLVIDAFTAFSRTFRGVTLQAGPAQDGNWYVRLQGEEADGYVRLPGPTDKSGTDPAGSHGAIVADFSHLRLPLAGDGDEGANKATGNGGDAIPNTIPPIRFICKDLRYHERPFGHVRVELTPTPRGIDIAPIDIRGKDIRIKGLGAWERGNPPGSPSSRFRLEVNADDLGKLLSSFGYEGKVAREGETRLVLDATWPGSPGQFELGRVTGTLDVKITKGRLLAIDPGATGRIFGLLSITQLPRILSMDFRDLYQDGFVYNRMEGKFKIAEGKAHTKNFMVDGPSSRIDITGGTGLVDQDYDQIATIIPKVSSASLPLAVLGAGIPLAAISIAQHLLDEPFFDKVFAYRYTIGGTWKDPEIELVKEEGDTAE